MDLLLLENYHQMIFRRMVKVAGLKWFPESDVIKLDISDLDFAQMYRGKKSITT